MTVKRDERPPLSVTHPEMAAQADGWDPREHHKGQVAKMSWRCSKGHTWQAKIVVRTAQGQGCPVCLNRAINVGVNDLATTRPDLAAQLIDADPTTITASTTRKVAWRCNLGHEWDESPQRRSRGYGCPYCSNSRLLPGFNDLATRRPDIAAEADGWDPSTVQAGGVSRQAWRCPKGHSYTAKVVARTNGSGCPVCAGKRVIAGENDLASAFPEIAEEADGWDPTAVTPGSKKVLPWKCSRGHIYESAPHLRTGQRQGCPYCAGRRVMPGFNDIATTHPHLAAEADGWDPTTVTRGSKKRLAWKCARGHRFIALPNSRTAKVSNCPVCANLIIEPGFNDLATTHPDLAAQAHGWDPTTVGGGSSKRLTWRCGDGHEWESTPVNRTWNKTGCPICANQLVLAGHNDLVTMFPAIAAQACGWDPTTELAGSKHKRRWRCELGHEWDAIIQNRTLAGHGCPYCGNKRCLSGFNDLATRYPHIAVEACGWDPSTVMPGSNTRRRWRCAQGHEWMTAPNGRTQQGQGCPTCAATGYDPNEPAWLYLLEHPHWYMQQIGITNRPKQRMAAHKVNGWQPIELRGPMDGHLAQDWERSILQHLRRQGVRLVASSRGTQPSRTDREGIGGEAWWTADYSATTLRELMDAIDEADLR